MTINILENKYAQYVLFGVILMVVVCVYIWKVSRLPTEMEFYVFDTKGDPSIFIRTPDDERILMDGGGNSEIIREITKVLPFYSRRIDEIIVTSDSGDGVTGLIDVVNRYKIGQIILPNVTAKEVGLSSSTDKIYETFIETIEQLKIPIQRVGKGDILNFNKNKFEFGNELKFEVLFPDIDSGFKYSKASPSEMILKIDYGETSFLLIGNASLKVQKFLAGESSIGMRSNVLVVSHNVATSSLSTNLLNVVKPEFIIYSQAISKKSVLSVNSKTSTPNKTDPLYMMMSDHRFNLKQKSTIEVLSDGKSVWVK